MVRSKCTVADIRFFRTYFATSYCKWNRKIVICDWKILQTYFVDIDNLRFWSFRIALFYKNVRTLKLFYTVKKFQVEIPYRTVVN